MKKNFTFTIDDNAQRKFKEICINKDISLSKRLEELMLLDIDGIMDRVYLRLNDLEAYVTELKEWKLSTTLEATK